MLSTRSRRSFRLGSLEAPRCLSEHGALRLAEAFADSPLGEREDERTHGDVVVFVEDGVGAGADFLTSLARAELVDGAAASC